MPLFYGWWRRLALLPLSTLLLGWLAYVAGFTLLMVHENTSSHPRLDYLPHYIAVASPLVLVILAGFHAAMFGLASSILGLFAAIFSVVTFSGVGYVLYECAVSLYESNKDEGRDSKYILMFSGSLLSSLSWLAVTVMWHYFPYKLPWGTVHSFEDVVDDDGNMTTPPPKLPKEPAPFAGVARKVAVVFIVLEAASWCVLITGVDDQVHRNTNSSSLYLNPTEPGFSFGTWGVCVIGALLILSAVLHAAANGSASALMGVLASVLSLLYITCLGHVIFTTSIDIYHLCRDEKMCGVSEIPRYQLYQLCGGMGCSVMWAAVLALWPFYFKPLENAQGLRRSIQHQREYYFQNRNSERVPLLSSGEHSHRPPAKTSPFF